MASWRDSILHEFTPKVARLTLVADPDGLLLEEGIIEGIRRRGFEPIPFDDHIAFRYAYESRFRALWDRGEHTDLVVVLHSQAGHLRDLPYDLLQAGRQLTFNLGDIFPNFSYRVLTALDRGDLETLYQAQKEYTPGPLGDNATKEFVLRHVFQIAPELIKRQSDLMQVLLRRHYGDQRIPALLEERFIQLLRQNETFSDWPLETLVTDKEAFLQFLQERWPIFLDHEAFKDTSRVCEKKHPYNLAIGGPVDLPFDHHDIRVYIDTLFIEGLLHPVSHERAEALTGSWVSTGLCTAPVEDRPRRLDRLIDKLQETIPAADARHENWFHFSRGWAELILLGNEQAESIPQQMGERIRMLQAQVDQRFTAWLLKRFAGLINLPPTPPVMLHHLPRFLCRQLEQNHDVKIALLVVDGLAMDQWLVVRGTLASRQPGLRFREQEIFAWIPSLSSVSRQAAFAGKAPLFFPDSIRTTGKESALWSQFWVDQGLTPNQVLYDRGLGDGSLDSLAEKLSNPGVRVAGLVIDKVDNIMHGMELGTAGMHNQVRQWAQQTYLGTLIELLLDSGFRLYLTSDHGNIGAVGCGRPAEGAAADVRGERVRIYPDEALRRKMKQRFPAAMEWEPIGLPDDYLALVAPPRQAFVREKQRIVGHGGISVEELIVPLVRIHRSGE